MIPSIAKAVVQASMPAHAGAVAAVKKIQTAGKDYLTQADLESALVKISPEGIKQAAEAKILFDKLDTNHDGKLTDGELRRAKTMALPARNNELAMPKADREFLPANASKDRKVSESEANAYDAAGLQIWSNGREADNASREAKIAANTYESVFRMKAQA